MIDQAALNNYLANEMIPRVNAIAQAKIYAFLPSWKQANYIAQVTAITYAAQSQARPFTADETATVSSMNTLWQQVEAIRSASNAHITNLQALTTFDDINNYDLTVGWP